MAVTLADLVRRCEVMDLPAATCAHCLRLPDPPRAGRWARAVYAGTCVECGGRIDPDDRIRLIIDGAGAVGECCGEGDLTDAA